MNLWITLFLPIILIDLILQAIKYFSYSSDATSTTNNALKFLWIPPEAENILKKYKNIFFKNVL